MSPHNVPYYTTTALDAENLTVTSLLAQPATSELSRLPGSSDMALPIVVPILVGVVLIVAVLLMPRGFFLDTATKVRSQFGKVGADVRSVFKRNSPEVQPDRSQSAFVERHLNMLRAWQKPKQLPQPLLPFYLAKPDATYQPHALHDPTLKKWQDRQRNTIKQKLESTRIGIRAPSYQKRETEEKKAGEF